MQFSIITASFNQGRFIRECIESVLCQGVEFEHIIVDACSTDETLDVLRQFPHLQWTSEPDTGQTDAINKGFRRARGELIMWLNADDYLMPGALAVVAAHIAANNEADIVYGDCDYVNTNGVYSQKVGVSVQFLDAPPLRLLHSIHFNIFSPPNYLCWPSSRSLLQSGNGLRILPSTFRQGIPFFLPPKISSIISLARKQREHDSPHSTQ